MSLNNTPKALFVQELFESGDYVVPVYQRNYSWGEKEINQLIDDIEDYCKTNQEKKYYIGSLVVFKRNQVYEVIDGQQRLTTLYILMSVLQKLNESFSLKFESREKAEKTLREIKNQNFRLDSYSKAELNTHILAGYEVIQKRLKKFTEEGLKDFEDYLLNNVQLLRVEVPEDTDLNHYFEIMNNRGEQLEKHEILKSRMLEKLKDEQQAASMFNTIWDACANMEKYVQYGFSTSQRDCIFGKKWNEFQKNSFDELIEKDTNLEINKETTSDKSTEKDIDQEKNKKKTFADFIADITNIDVSELVKDDDNPERFNAVINFSNFLLHVLKIQTKENIPLDDKRLLETFIGRYESKEDVKNFGFNLLKVKFLFDNYIIKREYTAKGDEWSLKQLVKNDPSKNNTAYYKNRFENEENNKTALMLLSMFHVSAPTLIYKHWLNAALMYLFEKEIKENNFVEYLERLAKAYMRNRFLSEKPRDYHEIIYGEYRLVDHNETDWTNLNKGTNVENFIFNYLDYLLWKSKSTTEDFSFAFRSSVEHFYPQNPMENIEKLDNETLDCFGNLCLITKSENSRLSNFTPKAKKEFYSKQSNNSLKQRKMMESENWTEKEIKEHHLNMLNLLKKDLSLKEIDV